MGTRKEAIEEAMLPWLAPDRSPADLPRAFAAGIEAGFAWHEGDEVLAGEGFLTEGEVITGAHQRRYEKELEGQLDKVLRWVELREGWISAGDTERRIEFKELSLEVKMIAEARKRMKGSK